MRKTFDKRILLLLGLTALAVVLTLVRERPIAPRVPAGGHAAESVPPSRLIATIVDTTLESMGVAPGKMRRVKVSVGEAKGIREELRVIAPQGFEVLKALTALTDSLRRFDVTLVSTENLREKTSSIHLLHEKRIFESIVITRERSEKGAGPSGRKTKKGAGRKTAR